MQLFIVSCLLYLGLSILERIINSNKSKEYILCSAYNYNGIIVAGIGQHKCLEAIIKLKPDAEIKLENQGFITSTGRFVDRFEAWDIAKVNKQIKFNTDHEPFKIGGKPMLLSINIFDENDVYSTDDKFA